MKTEIKMEWNGETLSGNLHLERLIAAMPVVRGFGWMVESDGNPPVVIVKGQKSVSLSQRGRGQTHACGVKNCPCRVVEGVTSEGYAVSFLLAQVPEINEPRGVIRELRKPAPAPAMVERVVATPAPAPRPVVIPKIKLPPVAPRRLETREDAEWYRAIFDVPHDLGKKAIWPKIWMHYAEKLGMSPDSGNHVKGLSMASLAILAGDPDPWKDWKWKPLFPGDTDSPLFQDWEV